jgi:hypothetical protein
VLQFNVAQPFTALRGGANSFRVVTVDLFLMPGSGQKAGSGKLPITSGLPN